MVVTVVRLLGIMVALSELLACGDDAGNRKIIDAPNQILDGAVLIDGAVAPVTVTVKGASGPTANVEVYFQNADSTLVATGHTDANGTASQVMAAGGYVTVVDPFPQPPQSHQLATWAGVKPGDHLLYDNSSPTTSTSVTFKLPLDTAHGTVSSYSLFTTCANYQDVFSAPNGTDVTSTSRAATMTGCGATADVMVVANDIDAQPLSYFYVAAQALTDGATVDYTAKTYAAATQRTFELDNNPSSDNTIYLRDAFVTSSEVFSSGRNTTGTTAITTFGVPALPTGGLDVVTTDQTVGNTERGTLVWSGSAANLTFDYGATLIGDFTVIPSLDVNAHTVDWVLGSGVPPQFSVTAVSAQRTDAPSWLWQLASGGTTQIELPTLPTDVADFTITASDSFSVERTSVGYMPGGYDAFRANAYHGSLIPNGASGTAAYNTSVQPELAGHAVRRMIPTFDSWPPVQWSKRRSL